MSVKKISDLIYFDNNATTVIPKKVADTMFRWLNMGNPSAKYKSALLCQKMLETFKAEIANLCEFSLDEYMVIFNSGASESNNHILNSTAKSYFKLMGAVPHFIISSVEHKTLSSCAEGLLSRGEIELTVIEAKWKSLTPEDIMPHIKPNTALISIMAANNETGIINNIAALKAAFPKIPFHSDTVQMFGKLHLSVKNTNIDAFSVSFHKLHGPAGVGLLVIKNSFIDGYKMCAYICGAQNNGHRGGTENIMGLAGSLEATRYTMNNLKSKIVLVAKMRAYLVQSLEKHFKTIYIEQYTPEFLTDLCIVFLAPINFIGTLPNTILMAVYRPNICNIAIQAGLEKYDIIVGLGSACNGGKSIINIPEQLKSGVIRISLNADNTMEDIKRFIEVFRDIIISQKVLKSYI